MAAGREQGASRQGEYKRKQVVITLQTKGAARRGDGTSQGWGVGTLLCGRSHGAQARQAALAGLRDGRQQLVFSVHPPLHVPQEAAIGHSLQHRAALRGRQWGSGGRGVERGSASVAGRPGRV